MTAKTKIKIGTLLSGLALLFSEATTAKGGITMARSNETDMLLGVEQGRRGFKRRLITILACRVVAGFLLGWGSVAGAQQVLSTSGSPAPWAFPQTQPYDDYQPRFTVQRPLMQSYGNAVYQPVLWRYRIESWNASTQKPETAFYDVNWSLGIAQPSYYYGKIFANYGAVAPSGSVSAALVPCYRDLIIPKELYGRYFRVVTEYYWEPYVYGYGATVVTEYLAAYEQILYFPMYLITVDTFFPYRHPVPSGYVKAAGPWFRIYGKNATGAYPWYDNSHYQCQ